MVINDEDGKQAALLVSRSAAVTGQKHNVVGSSPDTSVRVDFVKVQAVLLPNGCPGVQETGEARILLELCYNSPNVRKATEGPMGRVREPQRGIYLSIAAFRNESAG